MKSLLFIIAFFFLLKSASSQDYYYYMGERISLQQRTDKIAVVLNSNSYSKDNFIGDISREVISTAEVKPISGNVYLINFNQKKTDGEINSLISNIHSLNNLIKFITPVYYGESKKVTQIPTDEFIVKLRDIKDKERLDIFNAKNNISIIGNVGDEKGFLLKSNNGETKNALELSNIYFNSGFFEYAQPNFIYPEFCLLQSIPNDQFFGQQWALNNTGQSVRTGSAAYGGGIAYGDPVSMNGIPGADMDVAHAWDFTTGSSALTIGIIDTGIDSTHPDFNAPGHLVTGYDACFNKYGVPRDSGYHGTGTAGLIGAVMNNSIGVAGVANGCKIMSIKIFDAIGSSSSAIISRAFDTARVKGIAVLSNSWGGFTPITSITNAINNAAINGRGGLGCVIFFSSGNDGNNPPIYPSVLANVVSVGASTPFDQKKSPGTGNQFWWGANYGSDINGDLDVVAPTICYTTDVQGTEGYNNLPGVAGNYDSTFWGTSASCPNAAGVAALILSVNASQTRSQVLNNLYRGCDKTDNVAYSTSKTYGKWTEYYGYGRVNAYNSVRLAAGADVTPPTINHQNISSQTTTYPVNITAEIIDQDGAAVPKTGVYQPKLFFSLNKNNSGYGAFDSVAASLSSGNIFTFKVPCAGYETQVKYYIRASDNSGNQTTFPKHAPDPFWLCYYAVGTFNTVSNKVNGFVCAPSGVTYSPDINFGIFNILSSKVTLYVRHPEIYEIIAELYSPSADANNNRKTLFSKNGGMGSNITGATVSDSATQYWNAGFAPWTNGLYKGDYLMNGYNGTNANGNWRIMNYDWVYNQNAVWDSARITFTKTSGTISPSARLNSEKDSVLNFGTVNYPDSAVKNFYLKNAGTADLTISGVTFSGTYASEFSLINSIPGNIAPGDSGLFSVKINSDALDIKSSGNSSAANIIEDALMNINNNDPDKSVFKVSLQTDNTLPVPKKLILKTLIEGFYYPGNDIMIGDTMKAYIRETFSPYTVLDSSKKYVDSNGNAVFTFINISNGINYYIQLNHRNSIETWSNSPGQVFVNDTLHYDFTTSAAKAYGSNMIQVNISPVKFGIYGGDVDQNGLVELNDIVEVFNSASAFNTGYIVTDLNGDYLVDLSDLVIVFNNSSNFVTKIVP